MACANSNFYIKSTHYKNISYKIPCRQCINCRVDRRKMWKERCEYEFKKHITGAFVTFTYDEPHLYNECLVKGNDGKIRATTRIEHARKLIEAIRQDMKRNNINNVLMQQDFTYLGVSEYGTNGEIFDRPHYHILFFGLDFNQCKKLFMKYWDKGFIDSLPILKGGINYVLKYMDKQIMGTEAQFDAYKRYRLEPPKQIQSKGLGAELYYNNYKNAKKNNGKIKSGQRYIYIPGYYKNKMGLRSSEIKTNTETTENLKNYNIKIENPNKYIFNIYEYEKAEKKLKNKTEEIQQKKCRNLYNKAIGEGEPVHNIYNLEIL